MVIPTRVHTALRFDRIPIIGAALGLEIKRPCSHPLSIVALGSMTTRNQVTTLNWAPPPDAESVLGAQIGTDDTHALALKFSYKSTEDDGSQINKFAYGIYPMRISQAVNDDLPDGWLTTSESSSRPKRVANCKPCYRLRRCALFSLHLCFQAARPRVYAGHSWFICEVGFPPSPDHN